MNLDWYPPSPSEGPATMLDLPPDDWIIQAKMDGCRVVMLDGIPFTRQGTPLTDPKGAAWLKLIWRTIPKAFRHLTVEGELVYSARTLWVFDMPDLDRTLDDRTYAQSEFVAAAELPHIKMIPFALAGFREFYDSWKGKAEGVVMKKRSSLYAKQTRPNVSVREWLKRRYSYD